jgi:predicted MPP superfamily phosphohydrolase
VVGLPRTLSDLIAEDDKAIDAIGGERPRKVHVRRFAGPTSLTGRLDHLRVAHLTDVHVGRVTPLVVHEEAVARTNAGKPDLVVITGDFVAHSLRYLDQLGYVIGMLQAPVICTLGNHDYWSGAEEVRHVLERAGAIVLRNQWTTVTVRGQKLQVVGLDDAYTGHADRGAATKGLDRSVATLGLSHIGEEADKLWQLGVPLVLAGHTHGGQITLARLHELAVGRVAGHKYVHGLYGDRHAHGAVYVGAGIGASVMPLRVGERGQREVTIFELGHAPGAFQEHHPEQAPLPGRKPSEWTQMKRALAVEAKRLKRERKNGR